MHCLIHTVAQKINRFSDQIFQLLYANKILHVGLLCIHLVCFKVQGRFQKPTFEPDSKPPAHPNLSDACRHTTEFRLTIRAVIVYSASESLMYIILSRC